jgi:hypothetical protein
LVAGAHAVRLPMRIGCRWRFGQRARTTPGADAREGRHGDADSSKRLECTAGRRAVFAQTLLCIARTRNTLRTAHTPRPAFATHAMWCVEAVAAMSTFVRTKFICIVESLDSQGFQRC